MAARIYDLGWSLSAVIQVIVLFFLLHGYLRKYFLVFAYVALDLASTLSLTIADMFYGGSLRVTASHASDAQKLYTHLYWTQEVVLDLVLFLTVIRLTYRALEAGPARVAAGKLLGGIVLFVTLLPFLLFHPTFTPWPKGMWFNSTSEMLNFGGAIMNLALWTALIASKRRDPKLLTVSAGLGIVVTGAAISYGLRYLIPGAGFRWVPDSFLLLSHLSGLIIWCWAFRPAAHPRQMPSDAVTSH